MPLSEQDTRRWDRAAIAAAECELALAGQFRAPGRFQLEAAIQSVHAQRAVTGKTDWEAIAMFYEAIAGLAPTVGSLVGRAAALAHWQGPAAGLAALEAIAGVEVAKYQPYWAVRAHLLAQLGRRSDAQEAYARAVGLCEDASVRDFLLRQTK